MVGDHQEGVLVLYSSRDTSLTQTLPQAGLTIIISITTITNTPCIQLNHLQCG